MMTLFVASGHGVAEANLLTNAEIDSPGGGPIVDGWSLEFSRTIPAGPVTDLFTLEPWADRNADGFGGFFKQFQGDLGTSDYVTAHVYQDVVGTAGTEYVYNGYARAEENYSGLATGPTQTVFAIEFDDDNDFSNGSLSVVETDLVTAGLDNDFELYSVSGIAPIGTTIVRVRASMIDAYGTTGGQAFIVDEFSLTAVTVPEPTTVALLAFGSLAATFVRRPIV